MHDTSLFRKIVTPSLPAILLHRAELVAHLQETIASERDGTFSRYRLMLCCAPAGYGKTTLLADFAQSTSLACCWYFLERADADPVVFLRTLLSSIRQIFPQFGRTLDLMLCTLFSSTTSSMLNMYHAILDTLCTDLRDEISEHFMLILSNYEEINESDTLTDLVNYLLQKLPPQVTLVIESRVMPNISFASLIIRDAIYSLDRDTLRFTAQEIAALAKLQGLSPLTAVEAEHLATSFDGWIAGILLGTYIGDARLHRPIQRTFAHEHPSSAQGKFLAEYHRSNRLFTYVVNDVLKRDTAVHTFLQNISILQQIEPVMCNALFQMTNAADYLARLDLQGLFLTSYTNDAGLTYTCHPVIRHMFSEHLRQQEPEWLMTLHRRAAELWWDSHNHEQAMYHALECGAFDLAVSIILDVSDYLLQQGQSDILILWLHRIPLTLLEKNPQLLILQATIVLGRGEYALGLSLLAKAESLILACADTGTGIFQAAIVILRSKALCQMGEYPQAEALCHHILRQLPEHEYTLRAAAEMRLGICANLQGNFFIGITHLQQALHIWTGQPPLVQAVDIHNALANTYYWIGNVPLAQHHLTRVLDICEQLQDITRKGNALILRGLIAQDQGSSAEAEATFLEALYLARTTPHAQRGEAYALVNLGALAVEQGQYAQALTYAEDGLILARQWGNRSLINAALSGLALSYLFLGDPTSALLTVKKMEIQEISREDILNTVGYEHVWRDLTYSMILLFQGRHDEAVVCLTTIDVALQKTNFTRGSLQAMLRLAACRVAQDQLDQGVRLLEEIAHLLAVHHTYIHLVQVELQWLSALLPVIQAHPQLTPLRTLLGLIEPSQMQCKSDRSLVSCSRAEVGSPKLTIYAFGEPTVLLDGQPIKRWRMARAMELFFFLLDSGHPVSKEAILTALWPEYDERTSPIFHDTVYQLRKLLGEACIGFRATGYSLDLAACYGEQIWYDVQQFLQYQCEAQQALLREDKVLAKEALLKMIQLYRGDYGRPFENDWCIYRREELCATYLETRCQLAQLAWDTEAWNECAEHWRQILRLDNCHEEAHYGLMRCYIRQGKRGAALRQYQICQDTFEKELAIQPGPAIQSLYQCLRQNKVPIECRAKCRLSAE